VQRAPPERAREFDAEEADAHACNSGQPRGPSHTAVRSQRETQILKIVSGRTETP
jgi:hypothetical protein